MSEDTTAEAPPVMVFCLAQYLAEEMEARDWTAADVALRMGPIEDYGVNACTFELLLAVQEDGLLLGRETAEQIAKAFGVSADFIVNLDAAWRAHPKARQPFECPDYLFTSG